MKKLMAVVLAVFMLVLLTGCASRREEPNGIIDAVVAGYQTIDQSGGNHVRIGTGENSQGVILVDLLSQPGTLMRPYLFAEPGIDFYKIQHNEQDFSGIFLNTVNMLEQMQQSEAHKEITRMMDEEKLPEGVVPSMTGFMNMGYVPDPQKRCEIIFTGMSTTGEGIPLRDEVYAFCRLSMMDTNQTPMIMNALVTDQSAVYAIAQKVHQAGKLPSDVEAWMLRKLGQ